MVGNPVAKAATWRPAEPGDLYAATRITRRLATPNGSTFFTPVANQTVRHRFFGTGNFMAVLTIDNGPGVVARTISIVDFTAPSLTSKLVLTVTADHTDPLPFLQNSPGSGSACLVGAPTPVGVGGLGIYRSDKGTLLCPGPSPFQAADQILGEAIAPTGQANATAVQIKQQGSALPIGGPTLLPSGQLQVQPNNQTFPDVKTGGCPQPPSTRTFMLTNVGNDCITVSGIGTVAPYSATSSRPFPADLDPGVSLTATVTFAPGSVGPYNNVTLPITRTPSNGDSNLICSGKAVQALPSFAATPSTIDFGQTPVGASAGPVTITVKNTGDVPIAASIPVLHPARPFGGPDSMVPWDAARRSLLLLPSRRRYKVRRPCRPSASLAHRAVQNRLPCRAPDASETR